MRGGKAKLYLVMYTFRRLHLLQDFLATPTPTPVYYGVQQARFLMAIMRVFVFVKWAKTAAASQSTWRTTIDINNNLANS